MVQAVEEELELGTPQLQLPGQLIPFIAFIQKLSLGKLSRKCKSPDSGFRIRNQALYYCKN